jgi:CrcB protein
MSAYLSVALGSALGGCARFGVGDLVAVWAGAAFPWGTLLINATGSFAIGFFNTLTDVSGRFYAPVRMRQFVMVGFCGGYTTFSAFSLETITLIGRHALAAAAGYVIASMVLCLLAVWLGHLLAARFNRLSV